MLVYNAIGDLVDTFKETKPSGPQTTTLNLSTFAPGVYFYILEIAYDSGVKDRQSLHKFAVVR